MRACGSALRAAITTAIGLVAVLGVNEGRAGGGVDCSSIVVSNGSDSTAIMGPGIIAKRFVNGLSGSAPYRGKMSVNSATLLATDGGGVGGLVSIIPLNGWYWLGTWDPLYWYAGRLWSDAATNKVYGRLNSGSNILVANVPRVSQPANYVEIHARNLTTLASDKPLYVRNVTINGCPIDFDPGTGNGFAIPGGSDFIKSVKGIDLMATGDYDIQFEFARKGSQDDTADFDNGVAPVEIVRSIQVSVGFIPPPDNEGPETSNVTVPGPVYWNGSATVTATVDDTSRGGSNIQSAEYSLNGAAFLPMDAVDGAFTGVAENVTATFSATKKGTNEVCVRGTDQYNNVGDPTCQYFVATYKFTGFFEPINVDANNVDLVAAKAGQAIPAKWRITDANGVPIADPGSFAGLWSIQVSCDGLLDIPYDVLEEASGGSGLQYNGDGYWQFNWKTPKSYSNTCRSMYVRFDTNTASPDANFFFRK